MPTKHPRINIVFDKALLADLKTFAAHKHQSISETAKELIAQALELQEDYCLAKLGDERVKLSKGFVSHEDAWS